MLDSCGFYITEEKLSRVLETILVYALDLSFSMIS